MNVEILFDKNTKEKKLHTGWGVSFLVDNKILFDTGENGSWLWENMQFLDRDSSTIKAVVISHDHWDHTGGLWELLKKKKGLNVFAGPSFSEEFKNKVKSFDGNLIETKKRMEVSKDIFVTGEIAGEYKGENMPEQALVARTGKGLTVMTGCSHPGIIKIVEKVKKDFPNEKIYLVMGGFHLMDTDKRIIENIAKKFRELGVEKAGPTHCSGPEAEGIFKKEYKDDIMPIVVGETLAI